jgi:hypothetical protein
LTARFFHGAYSVQAHIVWLAGPALSELGLRPSLSLLGDPAAAQKVIFRLDIEAIPSKDTLVRGPRRGPGSS